jgi:hypothetical protein
MFFDEIQLLSIPVLAATDALISGNTRTGSRSFDTFNGLIKEDEAKFHQKCCRCSICCRGKFCGNRQDSPAAGITFTRSKISVFVKIV